MAADDLLPERLEAFFSHLIGMAESRSRRNGRRWLEGQLKAWPTAPAHGRQVDRVDIS
jgi:hypothetical protein